MEVQLFLVCVCLCVFVCEIKFLIKMHRKKIRFDFLCEPATSEFATKRLHNAKKHTQPPRAYAAALHIVDRSWQCFSFIKYLDFFHILYSMSNSILRLLLKVAILIAN